MIELTREEIMHDWAQDCIDYDVILQAKDAELEALALAVLNAHAHDAAFRRGNLDNKDMACAVKLARVIIGDGEVIPFRDIVEAKDAQIERLAKAAKALLREAAVYGDAWSVPAFLENEPAVAQLQAAIKEATHGS